MNENQDPYFGDEGLYESINRFEEMVNRNTTCYFDVGEFEIIIDYYLEQLNYTNAKAAIERGLKQHPTSSSIRLRLAQIYIQNGKPSKGLHFLREIEALEISNCDFYLLKGTALNILGKREDAYNAFDRAIQLAYDNKDDVIYSIAYAYINTRRYNLAIKYLLLAYEVNPYNVGVIYELAMVYEKIDNYKKSIEFYKKYLDIDPYAEHIWFHLGMAYSVLEAYDDAIDAYEFAIAISPDYISAYFSKGNTLVNSERYHEAIETFEEIIAIEPDNTQAFAYIGECYDKLELSKRSIYYYRKALTIDPDFGDAWYGLGLSYYNLEEYAKSVDYFKQANISDPENPDYWYMLGESYRKLNLLDKSVESFNRAVELDPNDYEAWLSHAEIFFMENRLRDAISLLNKAYEYNRENAIINYSLAALYLYDDKPLLAGKYFEEGLRINYSEHNEVFSRYPKTLDNELFTDLIKKYRHLSQ